MWDASSGRQIRIMEVNALAIHSIAFSADGKRLASASRGGTVQIWDTASGEMVRSLQVTPNAHGSPRAVAFSPDGRHLVCAPANGDIGIWNLSSGEKERVMKAMLQMKKLDIAELERAAQS